MATFQESSVQSMRTEERRLNGVQGKKIEHTVPDRRSQCYLRQPDQCVDYNQILDNRGDHLKTAGAKFCHTLFQLIDVTQITI